MNLSFAGCGFLGIYHVGVAVCFKKYAPHMLVEKIAGASAGAVAACCLLCDMPLGKLALQVVCYSWDCTLMLTLHIGPILNICPASCDIFDWWNKLAIHATRNVTLVVKPVLISLRQALLASAFVPFFSGFIPPKFHGVRYMDGGVSDNLPVLDENTITVSPFCGESDICPRDLSPQLFHMNFANTSVELSSQNFFRIMRILFPPDPEILSQMCQQGFDDALRFLSKNNLINCTKCVAVQSKLIVVQKENYQHPDEDEFDPECKECIRHREEALVANLPPTVKAIFQDAIDSANKGFVNWVFKHRTMRLVSIVSLPYLITVDFIYAVFNKFVQMAPVLGTNMKAVSRFLLEQVAILLKRFNRTTNLTANMICRIALTEYSSSKYNLRVTKYVLTNRKVIRSTFLTNEMALFQMNVTEIFDVTEKGDLPPPSSATLLDNEAEPLITIKDEDWTTEYCEQEEYDPEADEEGNNGGIFSDPESEWMTNSSTSSSSPLSSHRSLTLTDLRPESDQTGCQHNSRSQAHHSKVDRKRSTISLNISI
ncbi:1-acylglycerol-3-phosphate O-acyltransferase Pnpla3-like [Diaphorina citri]|uniref:1-acylglycerol-3-phosphate O-acyltransferase Pnpla3-like n=1 Tax=Diaphorina citri TaxID=121845 RepID=A0A3Q0JC43_DIACI|nr:1-acylglycerol-3-phosphate O-acyltransferase Pnpla3-like [Diaphorina citri]